MENYNSKNLVHSRNFKNCLFVSLIPAETTQEELSSYFFSNFGEVEILTLQKKPEGGTPQIAIIRPKSKAILKSILAEERHELSPGIVLKVEKYLIGEDLEEMEEDIFKRRVSIFGIYGKISDKELKEKFSIFGEVEVCYLKYYPDNPEKAHGFITFVKQEGAENALKAKKIKIFERYAKIKTFEGRTRKQKEISKSKLHMGKVVQNREDPDLQIYKSLNFEDKKRKHILKKKDKKITKDSKIEDQRDNSRQKFESTSIYNTFTYIPPNMGDGRNPNFPLPKGRLFKKKDIGELPQTFVVRENKREEIPGNINYEQNHEEITKITNIECQNVNLNHFYSQKKQISFIGDNKFFNPQPQISNNFSYRRRGYEYFEELRDRRIHSQMNRICFLFRNQEFKNTLEAILNISGYLEEVNHGWENLKENKFF